MRLSIAKIINRLLLRQNIRLLFALLAALFIFVASDDRGCADLKPYGFVNVNNVTTGGIRVSFIGKGLSSESVEILPLLSANIELESGSYAYTAIGADISLKNFNKFSCGYVRVIAGLTSNVEINF